MASLTANQVTNYYLYGQGQTPSNLADESLIGRSSSNSKSNAVSVNVNEFMQNGPGRYASPELFPLIKAFFATTFLDLLVVNERYTKQRINEIILSGALEELWIKQVQWQFDGNSTDYAERVYIWNSVAYMIDDRALFYIDENGKKHIENFALKPYVATGETAAYENFDFESSDAITKLGNYYYLEDVIDPSGLGKQVWMQFSSDINIDSDYTEEDYARDCLKTVWPDLLLASSLPSKIVGLVDSLFDSGAIKNLDLNNRPIMYGSEDNDFIDGDVTRTGHDISDFDSPLKDYLGNGIVYLGGEGADTLLGTSSSDVIRGGGGFDVLQGRSGDDFLEGGLNSDVLDGGDGFDTYDFDSSGFGQSDTVVDADGLGRIRIDGVDLGTQTFNRLTDTKWRTSDGKYELVSIENGGANFLVIRFLQTTAKNRIVVNNWVNGQLGITLAGEFMPVVRAPLTNDNDLFGERGTNDDDDNVSTLVGNDGIEGGAGEDNIDGGADADLVFGGSGNDRLYGGEGNDIILDGSERFNMRALGTTIESDGKSEQQRFDEEIARLGASVVAKGKSWFVYVESGTATGDSTTDGRYIIVTPDGASYLDPNAYASGDDFIDGGDGSDRITAGEGNDILLGGAGNDLLKGGHDHDIIYGGSGNDLIHGDLSGLETEGLTVRVSSQAIEHGNDILDGGEGDDLILGMGGNDVIYGGAGNDRLAGNGRSDGQAANDPDADYIDGGEGNDQIVGYGGADTLLGGNGADIIHGDSEDTPVQQHGDDVIDGGAGNDDLRGMGGNDTILGGQGIDLIVGDELTMPGSAHGNDLISAGSENDTVFGLGGNDTIFGDEGDDLLLGDADASQLALVFHGNDNLYGGVGKDELLGGGGDDLLDGGTEDDKLFGEQGNDRLIGGTGADQLVGGEGNDNLDGGVADDKLWGEAGNDRLAGGAGLDELQGGDGDDSLDGGDGNDKLWGDAGNDIAVGGNGLDEVAGGDGDDRLDGGADNDILNGDSGQDTLLGGAGNDNLSGNVDNDTVDGGDGNDYVGGDEGNDVLFGGQGNDTLDGGIGADALNGGDGNDRLYGAAGDDILHGGGGNDTMEGGLGNNTYRFEAGFGQDLITNFSSDGIDIIKFDATLSISKMQLFRTETNLAVYFGSGTELLLLDDYFMSAGSGGMITFADGTSLNRANILDRLSQSTGGLYVGTNEYDIINGSGGDDLMIAVGNGDNISGGAGNDVIFGAGGDDYLFGEEGNDRIDGGGGRDSMHGGAGDDWIDGGAGNDFLEGGDGSNTYYFSPGFGNDVVSGTWADSGWNRIQFANGIQLSDLVFERVDGDYLRISNSTSTDTITTGFFGHGQYNNAAGYAIGEIVMQDGMVLSAQDIINRLSVAVGTDLDQYLDGTNRDDQIDALGGVDNIRGFGGNDTIHGGAGDDSLSGNDGNDVLVGGDGADGIGGDEGNDVLIGGVGDDRHTGGEGNDIYRFGLGDGRDWINNWSLTDYNEGAAASIDILELGAGISPADVYFERYMEYNFVLKISGSVDSIYFNEFFNPNDPSTIYKCAIDRILFADGTVWGWNEIDLHTAVGNNTNPNYPIYGRNVADEILLGSTGSNVYGFGGDDVIRGGNGGDSIWGGVGNDILSGGAGEDYIEGDDGNDMLDGEGGADVLSGGAGDDTYIWGGSSDIVIERAGEGNDVVNASETYSLPSEVENLTLTGSTAIDGTGNAENNVIAGNNGINVLTGLAGNDRLDGKGGADTLNGGEGNDIYFVDNASDVVQEAASEGTDIVHASLAWTLGPNLENLQLLGTSNIAGSGNTLNNRLTGNSGNNTLTGLAGNDVLEGLTGNDTLDGGGGNDTLIGGIGNDVYLVDAAGDVVVEVSGEGIDLVQSTATHTLFANVENLTLTGSLAINGTGNVLDNLLTGNDVANTLTGDAGNDTLDGGLGNDTLVGGFGDDIYFVNATGDVVTELAGQGADTVKSAVTYTLSANLEHLTLTGTAVINGTGNASANVLIGNSGNNTLSALAGNDTLEGKGGTDTLTGGTGHDVYLMARTYGSDTVVENDTTSGNKDVARFLTGVAYDQLWFKRPTSSNNLEISIIGTTDKLVIKDWYLGGQYRVEEIRTDDGSKLLYAADVQALVTKMAGMTPPPQGQTTLSSSQRTTLEPTFASTWRNQPAGLQATSSSQPALLAAENDVAAPCHAPAMSDDMPAEQVFIETVKETMPQREASSGHRASILAMQGVASTRPAPAMSEGLPAEQVDIETAKGGLRQMEVSTGNRVSILAQDVTPPTSTVLMLAGMSITATTSLPGQKQRLNGPQDEVFDLWSTGDGIAVFDDGSNDLYAMVTSSGFNTSSVTCGAYALEEAPSISDCHGLIQMMARADRYEARYMGASLETLRVDCFIA